MYIINIEMTLSKELKFSFLQVPIPIGCEMFNLNLMDYASITNSFKREYDKIKYFGINMNEDEKISIGFILYSTLIQFILLGLFNILLLVDWVQNSTSIQGFASSGYIIVSCLMGHLKLLVIYKNRKQLAELMGQFKQTSFTFQNPEEVQTGQKEFRFFLQAKLILFCSTNLASFASVATPFLMGRHGELPFPAWYPVNVSSGPTYYVAAVHQSISVVIIANGYFHIDMLLCGILTFIGVQCNVLCLRVKNLGLTEYSQDRMLSDSIVHHWNIIRFLETTGKVFGDIYFWQLLASVMSMCMGLFLISLADPKSFEFYYLVAYIIAVGILLLAPCWFTSEMTQKSENIPIALYDCDWMNASNDFKKILIFFMQRTQQPLKMYAIELFEISLETFIKIIRSSLSYFAVLTNLNN